MTAPAPFLSRHLGDYLLVAQLSEDALGTVFRALYAPDERRFVRLRVLQSEELSAEAVLFAIREHNLAQPLPRHEAVVRRPQLDVVEGIPILTWDEITGWTLDVMLQRVRALGIRIPVEYALLITERIAAALEHVHLCGTDGRPGVHGMLWPGFVSISHDAAVRVGGCGVAGGVLPSLGGLRMSAEIAPYVAPEVRESRSPGASSDLYSLGAILVELVTGRRPTLEAPSPQLRASDPRSEELARFLGRCVAPPGERYDTPVAAHRALQQMLTTSPYSLYTANLALFLYKLLNPEGQSVAPSSDWESTNPVVMEAPAVRPAASEPGAPRRRRGDRPPAPVTALVSLPPIEYEPAPVSVQARAARLLGGRRFRWRPRAPADWARPAAGLVAAATLAVGIFVTVDILRPRANPQAVAASASLVPSLTADRAAPVAAPAESVLTPAAAPATDPAPVAVRPVRRVSRKPVDRRPAEDLRLRAALARIEASRLNAGEAARDLFGEGRQSEEEGERLLRQREYEAALMAFSRAARLFQEAHDVSWEERLRQPHLGAGQ